MPEEIRRVHLAWGCHTYLALSWNIHLVLIGHTYLALSWHRHVQVIRPVRLIRVEKCGDSRALGTWRGESTPHEVHLGVTEKCEAYSHFVSAMFPHLFERPSDGHPQHGPH